MHRLINEFIDLATRVGHWGYLLVFVGVTLECQAVLGLFMPGESLVLVAGFLAGQGVFDLRYLILTIAAAAVVGDSLGYEFGRHLGREWLRRHGARVGIREEHFARIDRFILEHGGKSVFASHFLHLFRAMMPFIAGSNRMPYGRFFAFNAAGCVVWAAVFASLGYFFGESWTVIEKWIGRAGAIIGAVAVAVLVLVRLWTWLDRHEIELRNRWAAFMARPAVAAFRGRFAREIEFIEERLSPSGYLGLHLTVGALIVGVAAWSFGDIAEDVARQRPLVGVDQRLADWFNFHATPEVTIAAKAITLAGSGVCLWSLSLVYGAWQAWRRKWHRVAALAFAVGGGALLSIGLNHLFQRERPVVPHPLVELTSYSFPSGHAAGATLFYGLVAFYIAHDATRWRWRVLAPLAAGFIVFIVGLARLYLSAHYLTDVLGAVAIGTMWLAFCITAVEVDRRYRETHRPPAQTDFGRTTD
jgi:undecaprenyl-diphosphatase